MAFTNNVMIVRHSLLAKLIKMWKEGNIENEIDYLPIKLSPRKSKVIGRCCLHKERAVWKYKSLPLLGYDMTDEPDELTPLSYYAKKAINRTTIEKDNIMCVIDEACSSCVHTNYEVTNLCRGCVARSCSMSCAKGAIKFNTKGQAEIDHDLCVSCGKCQQNCPYHAIVYIPVPCEEVCPVKAITKDEFGIEKIDESKCIYCGKCLNACPFGAIFEISQMFDILQSIKRGEKVIAMVAPSILGQYKVPIEKIYGALKEIGFHDIVEVAQGAMTTTSTEGPELLERLASGAPFMTTSCCPSYVQAAKKHIPEIIKYISHTGSPMFYTAKIAKEKYPDAKTVFIGPCIAKRKEGRDNPDVDYVLTFEEIGSLLVGYDIDFEKVTSYTPPFKADKDSYAYAKSDGVATAVKNYLAKPDLKYLQISNLNKKNIAMLKVYGKTAKVPAPFIEVMACEGGCATGPCIYTDKISSVKQLETELTKMD